MTYFKIVTVFLLTGFLAITTASPIPVAVLDFSNLTNDDEYEYLSKAIPEILITDLIISNEIELLERSQLAQILNELGLSQAGMMDSASIVQTGNIIGAKAIIIGSIIKVTESFRIDCRMTNVETGKITLAAKVEWTSEDDIISSIDDLAQQILRKLTGEEMDYGSNTNVNQNPVTDSNILAMEVALDNEFRLIGSRIPSFIQIDLYSGEVKQEKRLPLNLAMVIDRSGSMASQKKLNYALDAAKYLATALNEDDRLSIVTYESEVQIPVPSQQVINKDYILRKIKSITAAGSTFLSGGMEEGYNQVEVGYLAGQINRVLLLSDGLANKGIQNPLTLKGICSQKSDSGISLSTFGVGLDYNEDLMMMLSEYGNGNYYFIDKPNSIHSIFVNELNDLFSVTAQKVVLEIETTGNVVVDEVIGYMTETIDGKTMFTLSDMVSGGHKTIVCKLSLPPAAEEPYPMIKVNLKYVDAEKQTEVFLSSADRIFQYTSNDSIVNKNTSILVAQNANFMMSNRNLKIAADMVTNNDYDNARQFLEKEAAFIFNAATKYPSFSLKRQILNVHKYKQSIKDFEKKNAEEKKRIQKKFKYESLNYLKSNSKNNK